MRKGEDMKLTVVGLGPGAGPDMTGRAYDAIKEADVVIGLSLIHILATPRAARICAR